MKQNFLKAQIVLLFGRSPSRASSFSRIALVIWRPPPLCHIIHVNPCVCNQAVAHLFCHLYICPAALGITRHFHVFQGLHRPNHHSFLKMDTRTTAFSPSMQFLSLWWWGVEYTLKTLIIHHRVSGKNMKSQLTKVQFSFAYAGNVFTHASRPQSS